MSRAVVFIPVGKGAGRLPGGALAPLAGRPLLEQTLAAAGEGATTDDVVVVAADPDVAELARAHGARVAAPLSASPAAGGEDGALWGGVLAAVAGAAPAPLVALLDPWLPLRAPGRLDAACRLLRDQDADSLMTVCPQPPSLWRASPGGLIPFYDPRLGPAAPPSTGPWLRETGSLYVCRREGVVRHGARLFGRIAAETVDWPEALRVEDEATLAAAAALLPLVRSAPGRPGVCAVAAAT